MMRIADELTVVLWEHPLRVQTPRVLPQGLKRPIVQWNFSLTSYPALGNAVLPRTSVCRSGRPDAE